MEIELTGKYLASLAALKDFHDVLGEIHSLDEIPPALEESVVGNLRGVIRQAYEVGLDFNIHPEHVTGEPMGMDYLSPQESGE